MTPFARVISLLFVLIGCAGAARAQQEPAPLGEPIAACHLNGNWQSGDKSGFLSVTGKTAKWRGSYEWTGDFDPDTNSITLRRKPTAAEMDESVPPWARAEVAGKVEWRLEIAAEWETPPPSEPWLERLLLHGQWFSDTIRFEEKKTRAGEIISRRAWVEGQELISETTYAKSNVISQPFITVRPPSWPRGQATVEALRASEPFLVDVTLPCDQAAKVGPRLQVSFLATRSRSTATLNLSSANSGVGSAKVYTPTEPVTFWHGGAKASFTVLGLEFETPFAGMSPVSTQDGETVVVSYNTSTKASVRVYAHGVRKRIGETNEFLKDARRRISADIGRLPRADQEVLQKKLLVVNECVRALEHDDSDQPYDVRTQNGFVKARLGETCVALLLQDASKWRRLGTPTTVSGGTRDARFAFSAFSPEVAQAIAAAVTEGKSDGSVGGNSLLRAAAHESYLTFVRLTGAEQAAMALFGIDAEGRPVNLTDRILAGVGMGSQALLMGAGAAARIRNLAAEQRAAERAFENATRSRAALAAEGKLASAAKTTFPSAASTAGVVASEAAGQVTSTAAAAQPGKLRSFKGQAPASVNTHSLPDRSSGWSGADRSAKRKISEELGEAGMEAEASQRGYKPVLSPSQASGFPQGPDGIYEAADGTLVVGEAKGGYNGKSVESIMGEGYGYRQGTVEWLRAAEERVLQSASTNAAEKAAARRVLDAIEKGRPIRIEAFHTPVVSGRAGATRTYVLDQAGGMPPQEVRRRSPTHEAIRVAIRARAA